MLYLVTQTDFCERRGHVSIQGKPERCLVLEKEGVRIVICSTCLQQLIR